MNVKQFSVICASLLLLGACSSTSKHAGKAGDGTDGSGAYSKGVGDGDDFNGQNGSSTALVAPHNQTYYFDFDSNKVHQDDNASINAQAAYIAKHSNAKVLLTGNTDERGSREYNIALGERRGNAVADVLKVDGVSQKQIQVVSYGQEKPAAQGHDESAYKLNRRVEFIYKDKA